jgi:acetyl-CoA synthetase
MIYISMSIDGVADASLRTYWRHTLCSIWWLLRRRSLRDRIEDTGAVAVITADQQVRGGKQLPLKAIVDEAIALRRLRKYQKRFGRQNVRVQTSPCMLAVTNGCTDLCDKQATTCEPEWVGAEHPLFLLYTSGSTGKPKGVQHSTGGYLLHAALTTEWTFDLKDNDVFWCTADIGWVTGHTYITYGPLALGGTEIVFEGVPTYPDAGRFWKMIQDHKVDLLYSTYRNSFTY